MRLNSIELNEIENNFIKGVLDSRIKAVYTTRNNMIWRRCGIEYDLNEDEINEIKDCDWDEGRVYFVNRYLSPFFKRYVTRHGESEEEIQRRASFCLTDEQKQILKKDNDMLITTERQSGITTALAMKNVINLVFKKDYHIGIIAKEYIYKEIHKKTIDLLNLVPYYMMSGIHVMNGETLLLENGNSMVYLTKDCVGNNIDCLEFIDCNFMDKRNSILNEDTWLRSVPVIKSRDGMIIVAEGRDEKFPHSIFYNQLSKGDNVDRLFLRPLVVC